MGDPRRFHLFANLIHRHFPDKDLRIADVAGGKGYLQAALRQLGYRNIVTFDKRHCLAKPHRQHMYRYQLFDCRDHGGHFDLVLGMHPDGGTDHCIEYGRINRVPFIVCPCCVISSAADYGGRRGCYFDWMRHLRRLAQRAAGKVLDAKLPMSGRSQVIIGIT